MKPYLGIPQYLPKVCPFAKRSGNHFECQEHPNCSQIYQKEKHICPCFGRDFSGWIAVKAEDIKRLVSEVKRWNKARKQIPLKTPFKLKGIKYFRVHNKELLIENPEYFDEKWILTEVKRELVKLLENGDKIGFNEDWGVGTIEKSDRGFTVIKWYYKTKSTPIMNGTIDDVFKFLFDFWAIAEPFDYSRALARC